MSFFPLNVNLSGRRIVVIGGGAVAERKIVRLLEADALITVVAPDLSPDLAKLREQHFILHLARCYEDDDLRGFFLAIAATSDKAVNFTIAQEACRHSILADICDDPALSTFTMPAVIVRGDLLIAVSTGGKSPAMAKKIRNELESKFGPEYASALKLLGVLREKLLTAQVNSAYNKTLLSHLAGHDLPRLIKERRYEELDRLILQVLGFEFSVSRLFAEEKDPR